MTTLLNSVFLLIVSARRFYLIGSMTNHYPFIQVRWNDHLENIPLMRRYGIWNQYEYIGFNIFSCKILIISYKMLIITGISNEKKNLLTIHGKLCRSVTIFYRQKLASLF